MGADYRQDTYVLTGQVATERNNWYLTSYGYDDAGRVTSITEAEQMAAGGSTTNLLSYTKAYTYDTNDNRTGFTLTHGGTAIQTVGYTYDNLNRLSTVSEDGAVQATYTYDTDGNRASLTYANGVAETYTYNEANWVTGVYNKRGSTVLSSYEYTYYPSGNQNTKTDHTGKRTSYVYDGLGRLEQESDTSGLSIDYFYDAAQNRSSMYVDNGDESYYIYYTYNANNQLTQERKRQDGVYTTIGTYTYDGNGNQLTKAGTDGTQTYTYNGFNQQTGFAFGTVAASYAYNTSGIRTSKAINGARTSYLLDGGYVAAELQAGDTTPTTYLWGSNLIRREDGSDTSYYLYNAHGDVVNLTNTTGTVTKTYDYSAFGIEQNPDTTDTNPFRYCGEYYDTETETYYLRARYYNPNLGRFTQMDTHWTTDNMIYGDTSRKTSVQRNTYAFSTSAERPNSDAIIQSCNLFVYCGNNPIKNVDPCGAEYYNIYIQSGDVYTVYTEIMINNRPVAYQYTITNSIIHFDFEKNNYEAAYKSGNGMELAKAMREAGMYVSKTALSGRTVEGIDNELYFHWYEYEHKRLARMGIFEESANPADIGGIRDPGYDWNAIYFELATTVLRIKPVGIINPFSVIISEGKARKYGTDLSLEELILRYA